MGPDGEQQFARQYDFLDWPSLEAWMRAIERRDPAVYPFEYAVDAVVAGDAERLRTLLAEQPELVRTRSTRITPFDPPRHGAMLLHYVAANGVEGYRQKTPPNAVEIARILLEAGAEPDALAFLYGGECTTLSLLVSSCHPAQAGLQIALAEVLIDYGASVTPRGSGRWTSPVNTALVFGYLDTARALERRGAPLDSLAAAAGLGHLALVQEGFAVADDADRHRALALAAQTGQAEVVRFLLAAGVDPDRYNPPGFHAHSTPLHQAALAGHLETVRVLLEHGARRDLRDTTYQATALDWARHGGQAAVEALLR